MQSATCASICSRSNLSLSNLFQPQSWKRFFIWFYFSNFFLFLMCAYFPGGSIADIFTTLAHTAGTDISLLQWTGCVVPGDHSCSVKRIIDDPRSEGRHSSISSLDRKWAGQCGVRDSFGLTSHTWNFGGALQSVTSAPVSLVGHFVASERHWYFSILGQYFGKWVWGDRTKKGGGSFRICSWLSFHRSYFS